MGYTRNAVLIHAPLEEVFRLTNDVRNWPELFTEYAACEVLEEAENRVTFRLTTHPDENGTQWSWVSTRWTDVERKSTRSERDPSSGPFQEMTLRWWYNGVGENDTVMIWEQEFTMKPGAPFSDEQATNHLNTQTRIQQQVIKERVERMCGVCGQQDELYRGVIIAKHEPATEEEIVKAWERWDATELPHIIGIKSRHVWVQGDIYVHFIEGRTSLPAVLKEYAEDPLFVQAKADLDQYVSLLDPKLPPHGKLIYSWRNGAQQA